MSLPPGPNMPAVMQVLNWIVRPTQFLEECNAKFENLFTMQIPGLGGVVIVSDPNAVKELFTLHQDEGHAGKANIVLKPFLGPNSLLLLDGAEHKRQRKMMMPAFHGDRMRSYGKTMLDCTHASIDSWPVKTPFAVHEPLQKITLDVIVRTVFGIDEDARFRDLSELLTRALGILAWPPMLFEAMQKDLGAWSPWGRYLRISGRSRAILLEEVRRGRREGTAGREDVLAMLLDAKDESGAALSDDEMLDELVTLLVAGHETTATSLSWALRWILANPSLSDRVTRAVADAADDPEAIAKIELLDHCAREALRLVPVVPLVGRVIQAPMRILDHDIPAGTMVAPSIYLVHRRPQLYPDPARFDPDRYITFKPSPSEWLPFGGGVRRCIGAAFAIYEMKMVLAAIFSRVSMRLVSDRVRIVRRGITLTPAKGLPIVVTSKRDRRAMGVKLAS